ncbi:LPXTG cell wall anchor domain-containing protein [Streptomyces sp. NBC_00704]|uniref:LPXTG cell wall anchor domain-containing protein n=1 Tax=Streptomyces sp. NBC_00704 TaxID=2975809 RepID=UPI002E353D76|nr:LPXTG cell wall anchor domain-containing protein [Streptomyces sp. NBC_00704]
MRLCPPVSLCLAAAAAFLPAALLSAPAQAEPGPGCSGAAAGDFPLRTRIHGGPASYRAGGGYGVWYLDLTNTTRRTCAAIHPVVVLVDAGRKLKPSQPRLDFYAGGRPWPVRFEHTDDDELVGAFTGGDDASAAFSGFSVGPGRTLTVKLRLALAPDAEANAVTANAAVVQRHGDDGDWIGQSNDYRFAVEADSGPATGRDTKDPTTGPATDAATAPTAGTTAGTTARTPADPRSDATGGAAAGDATPPVPRPDPSASAGTGGLSLADEAAELARTGLTSPAVLAAAAGCLLTAGAALLLARRRR